MKQKDILTKTNIQQFLSYFAVGGTAALIEWICFFLLDRAGVSYIIATIISFVVATLANWFLGRTFTFKESAYKNKKIKEIVLVFFVSAIGLAFNLLLMYLFVDIIRLNKGILKTGAKIVSTGIVFIWNYLSRKLWIYRTEKERTHE